MAAAKLEGRAYLYSFVDAVLNKLSSPHVKSTPTAKKLADQKLLQRLTNSLRATRLVLDDAEQKQIRDQEVNKWLVDFQDALYLADDLLDELSTKAATATPTQRDPGNSSYLSHCVDSVVEYSDGDEIRIVESMKDIVNKLEASVEDIHYLGLKEGVAKDMEDMSRRNQTSLVESSDIYGRNDDKEAIIKLLLDNTCDDKLSVISIEGIGGIGKTTLAQLVYNDARVKEKFAIKAWVCVATKFDPVNVTKDIMEDIASSPCNKVNLNSIQTELKEKLTEKTFLVVLDDVWDNQQNLWDNFLKPFLNGNKESKILLTTRNRNVYSVMSTNRHYKLDILSDKDCWSLFLKHSSLSTNSTQYTTLEQIGRKIVEKCKGLPLAVKTLGGLLHSKDNVGDWENILESEIWELPEDESKIIPALGVSYHYLPSHLKRCFVYCSLYPQDYKFDKDELVLLWMAEGLLQPMEKNTLENIGCAYFDELVARSFFQLSSADDELFVMHDLMHDLATFFAGKFFFRVDKFSNPHIADSKTRHLSYNRGRISKFPEAYNGAIYMRTLLPVDVQLNDIECDFGLQQLKCLRVLSFRRFEILSLPDSIGELIHLRYLDLSYTPMVTLPESLCKLYNLQTLKLWNCEKLEMLPSRMQDLVNLRHLDIRGAHSLKEMPKGMSKLKHLNFLSDYIVGEQVENGIRELGALDDLHGSLCISNLMNVKDSGEALEAKMGNKKHIIILDLKWLENDGVGGDVFYVIRCLLLSGGDYSNGHDDDDGDGDGHGDGGGDTVDVEKERDILDKLQPHRNLKELSIYDYRGETFPDWLGLPCYSNITKLILFVCKNCRQVPSLGQLPSLQHLLICGLWLERIGGEFYNNAESSHQGTPFRSLQTLIFCGMPRWREWHIPDDFDGFPKLKSLSIANCQVLSGDLPAHVPALEELNILECPEMDCFGEECLPPSLTTLRIRRCQKLERWITSKGLQSEGLTHLILDEWDEVKSFPREGCLPASLKSLELSHFSNLEMLDCKALHQLTSLQQLTIKDCLKLENITQQNLPDSILKLIIKGECPLGSKLEKMNDPRIQYQRGRLRFGRLF